MRVIVITICFICCTFYPALSQYTEELWWKYRDSAVQETDGIISLKYSNKLLNIAQNLNDNRLIANSYIEITHDYNRLGNYNKALSYAIKAMEYFETDNEDEVHEDLAMVYNIISGIYIDLNNYIKSREYSEKAINSYKDGGDYLSLLASCFTNKGETYRLCARFDSAYKYFFIADSVHKKAKSNERRLAFANCNLGLACLGLNQIQKADSLLTLSFEYFKKTQTYYPLCISYYEIAKKAKENGNFKKAQTYAQMTIDMALEHNINETARDVYLLLSELESLVNNYRKANEFLKAHYLLKDSLINTHVVSQMAEMRAEFEIGRKQNEVDHFKDLSKARTTIAYLLSVGLITIVGLAVFLFRANKKRKAFNLILKDKNTSLNEALNEKDVLMREIHHRVKNNLQIISSIINLQSMRISNNEILDLFKEMQRRIMAISSIHQKLYQSKSVSQINMKDYIEDVVNAIHMAFNNNSLNVNYEILVQNIEMDIDSAVSIGLIVNELATNSYKYAFKPNTENHFIVALNSNHEGSKLVIRDNGPGIKDGFNIQKSDSLGLRMVNLLTRQRKGTIDVITDQGLQYTFYFKEMKVVNL